MDRIPQTVRSRIMSQIRSKNTTPERVVRSFLHAAGLRYAIHAQQMPGTPDIVLPSRRACVFVHGCFWHGCRRCKDGTRAIGSNRGYWVPKIARNRRRDQITIKELKSRGWRVFVIWECQITEANNLRRLAHQIKKLRSLHEDSPGRGVRRNPRRI
jgi:DNA mismatch endonuclease (patch repair protein)